MDIWHRCSWSSWPLWVTWRSNHYQPDVGEAESIMSTGSPRHPKSPKVAISRCYSDAILHFQIFFEMFPTSENPKIPRRCVGRCDWSHFDQSRLWPCAQPPLQLHIRPGCTQIHADHMPTAAGCHVYTYLHIDLYSFIYIYKYCIYIYLYIFIWFIITYSFSPSHFALLLGSLCGGALHVAPSGVTGISRDDPPDQPGSVVSWGVCWTKDIRCSSSWRSWECRWPAWRDAWRDAWHAVFQWYWSGAVAALSLKCPNVIQSPGKSPQNSRWLQPLPAGLRRSCTWAGQNLEHRYLLQKIGTKIGTLCGSWKIVASKPGHWNSSFFRVGLQWFKSILRSGLGWPLGTKVGRLSQLVIECDRLGFAFVNILHVYTGWWFQTWILFSISYMGCHPKPIDELIFFRGVAHWNELKPPISIVSSSVTLFECFHPRQLHLQCSDMAEVFAQRPTMWWS